MLTWIVNTKASRKDGLPGRPTFAFSAFRRILISNFERTRSCYDFHLIFERRYDIMIVSNYGLSKTMYQRSGSSSLSFRMGVARR